MRVFRPLISLIIVSAVAILVMRFLYPLPDTQGGKPSVAIPPSKATRLGAAILPVAAEKPGLSAVQALQDGRDAFAARVLLIRAAEVSLDVQYYIWQTDTTGWILLDELRQAAERGVHVRLLLDDNGIPRLDSALAALNADPNFEVRVFNPFTLRSPKTVSYLFDFPRLNRRMHNKSITADGVATIVGGRNIGDIYFAFGEGAHYFDLDVLAAGPAAVDVAKNFDLFWASESVYDADIFLPDSPDGLSEVKTAAATARGSVFGQAYAQAVKESPAMAQLLQGAEGLEWTGVQMVSDDPAKGLGKAEHKDLMLARLVEILSTPNASVDLVSAYFIPGEKGTDILTGLAERGIATRVMTNSLEATDVAPVHSAYMKYRGELVDAGVQTLELRANPVSGNDAEHNLSAVLTGSASSLHAKTFAIDGKRIFIGSFNFDPRSAALNTEMGFLIESPAIAQGLGAAMDRTGGYYQVRESGDKLEWLAQDADGTETVFDVEPNTSLVKRGAVRFLSWLPIEWLL